MIYLAVGWLQAGYQFWPDSAGAVRETGRERVLDDGMELAGQPIALSARATQARLSRWVPFVLPGGNNRASQGEWPWASTQDTQRGSLANLATSPSSAEATALPVVEVFADSETVSDRSGRATYLQPVETSVREGVATWVHPSLAGGLMRDGATRYDPMASGVVAANSWPLGTVLEVRGPTNKVLTVVVSDTGKLGANHVDMSEADFTVLAGGLEPGVIKVSIQESR